MKRIINCSFITLSLLFMFFFTGCKKKEVPVLDTNPVVFVLATTATCGGNIISDGGETVLSRGVCWSEKLNPLVADSKTVDGAGAGSFTSFVTGLKPATIYYIRAYATSASGTGYGMVFSFTTLGALSTATTNDPTNVRPTSAILKGTVNANYLPTMVYFEYGTTESYGTVLAATPDQVTGASSDPVSAVLTGLTEGTTYHFRVAGVNSLGTSYGLDKSFVPSGPAPASDVDGNGYAVIEIGTQFWFKENLKTTKYNDNTPIPNITSPSSWITLTTPAFRWYNDDQATYKNTYGALYNWFAVNTGKLCPSGWHVPSDNDFTVLTNYLGGLDNAGAKIKEAGYVHWTTPNAGATNETGFTALGAGNIDDSGNSSGLSLYSWIWSSTIEGKPYYRSVGYMVSLVSRSNGASPQRGFSIRCLKN